MYGRTYWQDQYKDQHGEIIQHGTPQDEAHFNHMENGIADASLAAAIWHFLEIQESYDTGDELHTATLGQTGKKWPFNNSETTVALSQLRENVNYNVDVDVLEYSGGLLGNIKVIGRAANAFKLLHDGSATTVRVAVRIHGGLLN